MPEPGDNSLSGNKPEIKPTVMNGGEAKKIVPTVMKGQSAPKIVADNIEPLRPSVMKPTIIEVKTPPRAQTEGVAAKISPTIIKGGEKSCATMPAQEKPPVTQIPPTTIKSSPPKPPLVINKPSAITGVARKGLEITKDELLRQFPGTADAVLEKAKKLLGEIVIEILSENNCLQYGIKKQQCYGELVEKSLKLSSHKSIQDSSRHIARLFTLLQEIALTFQEENGNGFAFWKKKDDPWEKFQIVYPEISQLTSLLNKQMPEIISIRAELNAISLEFLSLLTELDAACIATKFLSDQLKKESVAQCLLARSLSLAQTVVNIQQGMMTRESTIRDIDKLISRIQDSVLIRLPVWIEHISLFQSKATLTETDIYSCRQELQEVINH